MNSDYTVQTYVHLFDTNFSIVSVVQAYLFNDYWEDIGTIKSFFDANLALTKQVDISFI